jgi:hypothetical protein
MLILLPPPSPGGLCSGIFVGGDRHAELGAPGKGSCFNRGEALGKVRGRHRGLSAEGIQFLEEAPEDHPLIIAATGAANEVEPSLQALKPFGE